MTDVESSDRRIRRTHRAVFDAFKSLVLTRPYDDIRVADIVADAGIGRSTFYEHFRSKDDVLTSSITWLFSGLADAAVGSGVEAHVEFVLDHFWQQRSFARVLFKGRPAEKLTQRLAELIEARAQDSMLPRRLAAKAAAAEQLGILRAWLQGEVDADMASVKSYLLRGHQALVRQHAHPTETGQ